MKKLLICEELPKDKPRIEGTVQLDTGGKTITISEIEVIEMRKVLKK